MPVRLFVGNLPYETTEAEIREHFSAVASPSYVYLPTDRESGRPRGFAFVEFDNQAQADEAIRRFNNQPFKGRPLAVNEARARENSPGPRKNTSAAPPPRTKGPDRPDSRRHARRAAVVQVASSVRTRRRGGTASVRIVLWNQTGAPSDRYANGSEGNSLVGMSMILPRTMSMKTTPKRR